MSFQETKNVLRNCYYAETKLYLLLWCLCLYFGSLIAIFENLESWQNTGQI